MFDTVPTAWVAEFAVRSSTDRSDRAAERVVDRLGTDLTRDAAGSFAYYVTDRCADHYRLLAGPFRTSAEATRWIGPAQDLLAGRADRADCGVVSVVRLASQPRRSRCGDLNDRLGLAAVGWS